MFIAALFTIGKTWMQSKCPLTDEWIQMCFIYILPQSFPFFSHSGALRGLFIKSSQGSIILDRKAPIN